MMTLRSDGSAQLRTAADEIDITADYRWYLVGDYALCLERMQHGKKARMCSPAKLSPDGTILEWRRLNWDSFKYRSRVKGETQVLLIALGPGR